MSSCLLRMNDSSDEDDLEALRLEALKSLKPRNQAHSTQPSNSAFIDETVVRNSHSENQLRNHRNDRHADSEHTHESSSSHWNQHEESGRFLQDRSHYRHETGNKSNHHLDLHSSSKIDYKSARSFEKNVSFRERSFAKQNEVFKSDSSRRNNSRNSENSRRRTYGCIDRRRNSRLRRSYSPDGPSCSNSNISHRKYSTKYRNPKSVSPSNRGKSKSPHRSNLGFARKPLSKTDSLSRPDEKATDTVSSLPLCSPKHYVELFYGKNRSISNLNSLSDSNLVLNDEDRALLSEKSHSEKEAVPSAPNEVAENSEKLSEPNQTMDASAGSSFSKDFGAQQVKRIEESLRRRRISPRLLRSKDRTRNERPTLSRARRLIQNRGSKETKHDERSPSRRVSSGVSFSERDQSEEKLSKTQVKTDEPLDPVLEARRKKFESKDVIKVVPKRIKLTNQPTKIDSIQTDETDLRNILIAKHREKSMSLRSNEIINAEDHLDMSDSSPLNVHFKFDEGSTLALTDDRVFDASDKTDYFSSIDTNTNSEPNVSKECEQVRVKVEVEKDIDQSFELELSANISFSEHVETPPGKPNADMVNQAASYLASDLDSNTENIPVFQSADYASAMAIKKEPVFNEPEETPKIEEEKAVVDEPDLIPQQPDNPGDSSAVGPMIKIKPLTELLDKKVLKKVKKSKKKEEKSEKKRKKKSKSKDKDRENNSLKLAKRASKILSRNVSMKDSFPTRIVRSALEEALGKKKQKVFEDEDETVIRKTNLEHHSSKDHRKVLILDEPTLEETHEESSPSSIAPTELEADSPFEENLETDSLTFRLSSKAPLYCSKKAKKRPDIYKMIQLNQV